MYAIFNYQSFNSTLTNDIVSFDQLGPDYLSAGFILNPFMPEFLKWTLLTVTLDLSTDANRGLSQKSKTHGKQCRS